MLCTVTVDEPSRWGKYMLAPGSTYVVSSNDIRLAYLGANQERVEQTAVITEPLKAPPMLDCRKHDVKGKSAFISRKGGMGDLLMMAPMLVELRRLGMERITFGTAERNMVALQSMAHDGTIDRVVQAPYILQQIEGHDFYLDHEFTIEDPVTTPAAREIHGADLFLQCAGIDSATVSAEAKCPTYDFPLNEYAPLISNVADAFAHMKGRQRVVIHAGEHPIRGWPLNRYFELAKALGSLGYQAIVIGPLASKQPWWRMSETDYLDMSALLNVPETLAMICASDLFISTDTGFLHFAGAMRREALALFGPFPSRLRTAYYPTVDVIEPDEDPGCGKWPCMCHQPAVSLPCQTATPLNGGGAKCMEAISVEHVLAATLDRLAQLRARRAASMKSMLSHVSRVKDPAAVALGRKGGKKGGKARADALTSKQRKAIASKAGRARWDKGRKDGP